MHFNDTLWENENFESRAASPENPTGERGAGAMSDPVPGHPSERLGKGWKCRPCIHINSGETAVLAELDGPGIVRHIWMTCDIASSPDCLPWNRGSHRWRDLIIRIYWDDQVSPSVECPVGDFFACGLEEFCQINSAVVTVNPGQAFNCFWDMPFRKHCRITLENRSPFGAGLFYQIDYAVCDRNAEYKTFTYSVDGIFSSLECTVYPFVEPESAKKLAPVEIYLGKGDWTDGADIYRSWLKEAGFTKRPSSQMADFTGCSGWTVASYYNNYSTKYVGYAPAQTGVTFESAMDSVISRTSLKYIWLTGWHDGGFDTLYPDYQLSADMGGSKGFRKGIENIHSTGGKAILYVNAHIADVDSKFYKSYGETASIKKPDGSIYNERYYDVSKTEADFVAMCPSSGDYLSRLIETVKMLSDYGADGIYFDQISEMESYLCFDKDHGHSTPATAYYEGYSYLLAESRKVFENNGIDPIFGIEGVCDCYGANVDVFFAYPDFNLSELTRYTLSSKIIGRDRYAGTEDPDDTRFSSAFVLSEPFVVHKHHVDNYRYYSNPNLQRYVSIYEKYPEIYLCGRYDFKNGLSGIPGGIDAGVILSEDGSMGAINIFGRKNLSDADLSITYLPDSGILVSAKNAETGENLLVSGKIQLVLKPHEVVSVVVEIK